MTQPNIREFFWDRVRKLRVQQWYSQEEFASKCWVHRTYMWVIERWEKAVSIDIIEKIAKALKIEISDIFK